MPLWGNKNQANNAPKYKVVEDKVAQTASRGNTSLFNNTTPGVFHKNQVVGVWGANATQVAANPGRISHTGWQYVRQGTGPVKSLTINAGGSGYTNTDTVRVAIASPGVNATATVSTNSTGGITTLTITSGGSGFANTSSATISVLAANGSASAGSNASLTPVFGGRAGRIHYETLVAGSMKGSPPNTLP